MSRLREYVQVPYLIDDKFLDRGLTFEVIEPLWFGVITGEGTSAYRESCRRFSQEQVHLYAIWQYFSDVLNGGHDQFCFNHSWIARHDAIAGFRAIGLDDFATIIRELLVRLGVELSDDVAERRKQLEQLEYLELDFGDLDTRFYNLERTGVHDKAMLSYINSNRQAFYFKGEVRRLRQQHHNRGRLDPGMDIYHIVGQNAFEYLSRSKYLAELARQYGVDHITCEHIQGLFNHPLNVLGVPHDDYSEIRKSCISRAAKSEGNHLYEYVRLQSYEIQKTKGLEGIYAHSPQNAWATYLEKVEYFRNR